MSEETIVPIPAETQNPAEETTDLEVVAQEATDDAGEAKSDAPAKTPEQIEIERLRRALTKRDRTQGRMHSELEQLKGQLRTTAPPATEAPKETVVSQREVLTLAQRIADQKEFDAKCNSVASEGKKAFADFSTSLTQLIDEAGPLVDPATGWKTPLGEQILESDKPHALIHYLGKNPEIAAELDGLTPGRLARKLASIELAMDAKPKTSTAPKPLEPVRSQSKSTGYHPEMSDREFDAMRRAQIAQRK